MEIRPWSTFINPGKNGKFDRGELHRAVARSRGEAVVVVGWGSSDCKRFYACFFGKSAAGSRGLLKRLVTCVIYLAQKLSKEI